MSETWHKGIYNLIPKNVQSYLKQQWQEVEEGYTGGSQCHKLAMCRKISMTIIYANKVSNKDEIN